MTKALEKIKNEAEKKWYFTNGEQPFESGFNAAVAIMKEKVEQELIPALTYGYVEFKLEDCKIALEQWREWVGGE